MKIQKAIDYFRKQGFNCMIQPEFPEIIAWGPLKEANGTPIKIPTFFKQNKKQIITPFVVIGATCKKPTKRQMVEINKLIGTMFSSFAHVREKDKKIVFDITSMEEDYHGRDAEYIG